MLEFFKQHKLLSAFLYSFIIIGIAILFLPIRFEENDDVVMLLLASGNYTGNFESNLVFINPIYGAIVSSLYFISKEIEWYTVLFVSFHLLSFTVILDKIIQLKIHSFLNLSLVILFTVFELNFLVYLQFTTVAIMLTIAGLILYHGEKRKQLIPSFLFILIAALIRPEVTFLILIFVLPYFFYTSYILKSYRRLIYILFFLIIPVSSILIRDKLVSNEWTEATKYNRLRAEVTDNLNADFSESIYKGVCSKGDYTLLKNFFPNPNVITMDVLKRLSKNIQIKKQKTDRLKNIKTQFISYLRDFILLFLIVGMFLFFNKNNKYRLFILLYSVFLISVLAYISIDGLLKNRIFIGFVISFILVFIFSLEVWNDFSRFQMHSLSIGLLLLSFYYTRRLTEKVNETLSNRNVYLSEQIDLLTKFHEQNPNNYVTPYGDDLKLHYLNPFEISKISRNWNLYYLGWMTKNPHNERYEQAIKKELNVFISNYSFLKTENDFNCSRGFSKMKNRSFLNSENYRVVSYTNKSK
jgi:hypothetical protein